MGLFEVFRVWRVCCSVSASTCLEAGNLGAFQENERCGGNWCLGGAMAMVTQGKRQGDQPKGTGRDRTGGMEQKQEKLNQ